MKFVTFANSDRIAAGVLRPDGHIVDLGSPAAARAGIPGHSLIEIIAGGATTLATIRAFLESVPPSSLLVPHAVRLLAPIPRPAKNVFCVGRNYLEHVKEGAAARLAEPDLLPKVPQFFSKPPTTVVGPDAPIRISSAVTAELDYEVELGIVIGRTGRDICAASAFDHVFGYTIINDITGRDLQRAHDQWFKGKGLDGSCPMGPCIVSKEEVDSPAALQLSLTVNGELRQRASCSEMIFDIPTIVACLSAGMTLEAGDIIATGTPSGVGFSFKPPRFLEDHDVVVAQITGIGQLINRIERTHVA